MFLCNILCLKSDSTKTIIFTRQGRRKIDNWGGGGGGGHILIYSCYAQLISCEIEINILKSIVFTVCKQEYMNMCPSPPIIDLPASLSLALDLYGLAIDLFGLRPHQLSPHRNRVT